LGACPARCPWTWPSRASWWPSTSE
jgi:hypothetical protein